MPALRSPDIELILSDLHHRISGVSATVRALVPLTLQRYRTGLLFQQPIGDEPRLSLRETFRLLRTPPAERPFRIWHVRRNNEMFWGLVARDLLRCPVKLVFTSAAIRRHSWYPRQLIKRMDAIIATSTKGAGFVAPVAAIVPHGVDVARFESAAATTDLLTTLKPDAETLLCGIVGRVRPEKGTDLFVSSMLQLMPQFPQLRAVIAGSTTAKYRAFRQLLERQISAAGLAERFTWLDEVPYEEMPKLYSALDIVCSPALYEGFGVVPIEAMVSGTAVVASRTGAYEDMVDEGRTGFLTECGDVAGLTSGVQALLADPVLLSRCRQAGQEKVRQKFSITAEFEGISAVYEHLWQETAK